LIIESTLNKKHNAFDYHIVQEAVTAKILRVTKEERETNLANVLTKLLPQEQRNQLLHSILYSV
jgi:hypothetical protein